MKTKKLGNSELYISRIGFGAWAIGGGQWEYAWGAQDDNESIRAIHHAIESGINWIDTASIYGHGHSERVVGKALRSAPVRPLVFTKCGFVWDDEHNTTPSLAAASVRSQIDASLERLGIETIDLYQVHWPNPQAEIEEAWRVMEDAQRAGKIRYLGASNFNVGQLERVQAIAPVTSLQPPYSMVFPEVEQDVLPYCEEQGIGVINYSPMASGLLTGKMTRERLASLPDDDWRQNPAKAPHFAEPQLTRNLGLVDLLSDIAGEIGCSVPELAIAWTLHNPAVTGAIVGLRSTAQVDGVIGAADVALGDEQLARIRAWLEANP